MLARLLKYYQGQFPSAETKDAVDEMETKLVKNFRNNFTFRQTLLDDIVGAHNMADLPRVTNLQN
jgi:hypothetical protein